jgi:hypothetical protein
VPISTYTNSDIDSDDDIDSGADAIADALSVPDLPDREVIAPVRNARGVLLPTYRVWMRDGYTLLTHAHTPGEAMGNAIDDARTMIDRTGLGQRMSNRERRLATTVDCWQQVG